jgi:outer membrane protein
MRKSLKSQYKQLEAEISTRENKLREKSKSLQNKYELNLISESEAKRINDEIQIESQNLMELNQQYSDKISDVEYQMNINFIDSVYNYLERFNENAGFDYILGFAMGSNILYAKDTLDITNIVVKGLNEEYRKKYPEED